VSDAPAAGAPGWTGRFHDGLTALGRAVEVRLGAQGLAILDRAGAPIAEWRYDALVPVETVRRGEPAVLARDADDDARLTLVAPPRFEALIARAPQLAGRPLARALSTGGHGLLWLVVVAALGAALWFGWPKLADGLAALIPASVETRIAGQARTQLLHGTRPCTVAPAQAVLDRLGAPLTAAARYDRPVAITVVDRPIVNALALPGDQILVFRRLIAEAQSPEELAAVLAHELGHLAAHHPMRNLVRQFGLTMIITALSGSSSWDGVAELLLAAHYTRAFEAEADARALETLAAASVGGQGWIDFFDRHAKGNERLERATAYLSSHPPSAERRDLAARLPPTGKPVMSAGDWLVLRSICGH
jgi:Zn-dependent protease with chaperone function